MTKYFSSATIMTWQLRLFGLAQIPLILFCQPRIIKITDTSLEVKIKLNRRTRNHLKSMYFGALSVGADVTGGFLAMKYIQESKSKISLIFKDFNAEFLKRAEGDVHFSCSEGDKIKSVIEKAEKTGDRVGIPIHIYAWVPTISDDLVAKFILTLSVKKK